MTPDSSTEAVSGSLHSVVRSARMMVSSRAETQIKQRNNKQIQNKTATNQNLGIASLNFFRSRMRTSLLWSAQALLLLPGSLDCASSLNVDAVNEQPNILYIMADDLNNDWKNNRLEYMPNLRHYFRDNGVHFSNHVAAIPVCGPSRSSMLLGRFVLLYLYIFW